MLGLMGGWGLCICFAQDAAGTSARPTSQESNGNALCYTCHLGLKNEEITAKHIAQSIACPVCHGPSVEHMHDEMQVTKPDVLYGRAEINGMCSACHAAHKDAARSRPSARNGSARRAPTAGSSPKNPSAPIATAATTSHKKKPPTPPRPPRKTGGLSSTAKTSTAGRPQTPPPGP